MNLGVCIRHAADLDMGHEFRKAKDLGFRNIQLVSWDNCLWTEEEAKRIAGLAADLELVISEAWIGWRGPKAWNFYEGHETLGFLPQAFRQVRMDDLIAGSAFAKRLGVDKIITHAGYIPENPHDPNYHQMITILRHIAQTIGADGQSLLLETGQETPVTLLRALEDIGLPNVGINLDPANLIMYGKANPIDAIDTIGPRIVSVHAKDGLYPTDGRNLGVETAMGEGKVDFPRLLPALHAAGFTGTLTIEREISGEQQTADIRLAKQMLEDILADLT